MNKTQFENPWFPYLLLFPQLLIVVVFFYWPAAEAIRTSFFYQDPFGFGSTFAGLENYQAMAASAEYVKAAWFTLFFVTVVAFFSLSIALLLAVKADKVVRGARSYRTALMWVYAIAPPVAGLLGILLFDQRIGPVTHLFEAFGWNFRIGLNYWDTAIAVIIVSIWIQVPVNFIYFLSGLQSIPKPVREAALIDNESGMGRFWTITLPLLAPTGFFLMITNITYALFDTFGVFDVMFKGQPGNNPIGLVYKVYLDGFRGNDIGGSSAQSVVLMVLVLVLTVFQFRFIERRVHYN